jgi:HK97 family phage major capsid protein
LVSTPVQTIAHYVVASRQILSDAAQLQNQIDNRLTYGLALKEDQQLLYGTGSSGELEGLMVNASVQDAGGVATGDNLVDHIRKAIALAATSEYLANGIILNPTDFAAMELLKGDDGHSIWANVGNAGEPRLWRVPVYESTAMTAGSFILGNWNLGATLFDREQATVRIAEQHADLFIKNGVVVLGEERVALAVYRPQAFVKGVFTAAV